MSLPAGDCLATPHGRNSWSLPTDCRSQRHLCYDRRSVGQPILVSSPIWGPRPEFCYRQLRVCWCGALSLTREWVCHLQLLLVLASTFILASESGGTHDHILLSQIRDFLSLKGQVPVFMSPSDRVDQLHRQALGSLFVAFYGLQGYGGGIRTRLHTGYDSQQSGRSVKLLLSFSSAVIRDFSLLESMTKICILSYTCTCFEMGPPLRRRRVGLSV
jgi:hypothetical protein